MANVGRPSKYTPELLEAARAYVDGKWEDAGDVVPSIVGLSLDIDIDQETAHRWEKEEGKEEFSKILKRVRAMQHRHLVNKGLSGDTNPVITKMMLTKHGYSDKIETENKHDVTVSKIERVIVKATDKNS